MGNTAAARTIGRLKKKRIEQSMRLRLATGKTRSASRPRMTSRLGGELAEDSSTNALLRVWMMCWRVNKVRSPGLDAVKLLKCALEHGWDAIS